MKFIAKVAKLFLLRLLSRKFIIALIPITIWGLMGLSGIIALISGFEATGKTLLEYTASLGTTVSIVVSAFVSANIFEKSKWSVKRESGMEDYSNDSPVVPVTSEEEVEPTNFEVAG